LARLWH